MPDYQEPDYKELYLKLFRATEETINRLIEVQQVCEVLYQQPLSYCYMTFTNKKRQESLPLFCVLMCDSVKAFRYDFPSPCRRRQAGWHLPPSSAGGEQEAFRAAAAEASAT